MLEHFLATVEQAGNVRADAHDVPSNRLEVNHVVEGGGAVDIGLTGAGQFSNFRNGPFGQVAILLLGEVQQRQHGRSLARVERDGLFGATAQFTAKVVHRSTSPITGSTVEITVTVSDKVPPRKSSGTACRFVKLGARVCIRYGLAPPSATR